MSRFGRCLLCVAVLGLALSFAVRADDPPADPTTESAGGGAEALNKGRAVIDPNG